MIATLGAMAAAWLVGHASQFRPVRCLVDTAQALGRGELSARATMEPWQAPEFRVLGATLNSMAAAIAQGQKNLRDSEAELRLLADNATDMIFKLDLDFRRTYVSPSSREVLGYEPHELIGKRPANMAHPDDVKTVSGSYQNLVSGQERSMTMTRIQHKDGRWIWIEVHKRALLDPETGAPIGIIGSMRDISARKEAEEAVQANEALLRGVFDHTPDSILVISVGAGRDVRARDLQSGRCRRRVPGRNHERRPLLVRWRPHSPQGEGLARKVSHPARSRIRGRGPVRHRAANLGHHIDADLR